MRKKDTFKLKLISALIFFFIASLANAAEKNNTNKPDNRPLIISSIKPIDSIVRAIGGQRIQAKFLVGGKNSPHTYRLKPSDRAALKNAKAIFYIDDNLEIFLKKALKSVADNKNLKKIALFDLPNIKKLKIRTGEFWGNGEHHDDEHDEDEHGHDEDEHHEDEHDEDKHDKDENENGHDGDSNYDLHIWLSTQNVKTIAAYIKDELSQISSKDKDFFTKKLNAFNKEINKLDLDIKNKIKNLSNLKFLVYHDAYQYFENQFNISALAAINTSFNTNADSIKHKKSLTNILATQNIACVFSEPQFSQKKINDALDNAKDIKVTTIDPLGSNIRASGQMYFKLIGSIIDSLQSCQ